MDELLAFLEEFAGSENETRLAWMTERDGAAFKATLDAFVGRFGEAGFQGFFNRSQSDDDWFENQAQHVASAVPRTSFAIVRHAHADYANLFRVYQGQNHNVLNMNKMLWGNRYVSGTDDGFKIVGQSELCGECRASGDPCDDCDGHGYLFFYGPKLAEGLGEALEVKKLEKPFGAHGERIYDAL